MSRAQTGAVALLTVALVGCTIALTAALSVRVELTPAAAPHGAVTHLATPTPDAVQPTPTTSGVNEDQGINEHPATPTPPAQAPAGGINEDPGYAPGMALDWTADASPPEPDLLPLCHVADDDGCYYPGRALGDRCDWVNSPGLVTTWFFNCDDPSLEKMVTS